jgi:hypothetical protein
MIHQSTYHPMVRGHDADSVVKQSIYKKQIRRRSEVIRADIMKTTMLWDVTQYSRVKVHRAFRDNYCLHVQVRKSDPAPCI